MAILLQWLLPIQRYKRGSLECSKVFAAPPCLPFTHGVNSWIVVYHGISKRYFFGCRRVGSGLEIMKHNHHQHHKSRCWIMLIEMQNLGFEWTFVKHCCTYMWPLSLNDLRLTEGTSLDVKYDVLTLLKLWGNSLQWGPGDCVSIFEWSLHVLCALLFHISLFE